MKHRCQKGTCWWNTAVDSAVKEKRRCWKTWKNGGGKEEYQKAKRLAKYAIWQKPRLHKKSSRTLHPAALTFSTSTTKSDAESWMSKARKLSAITLESCAWTTGLSKLPGNEHYERLSNVEFDWDPDSPTEVYLMEGLAPTSPFIWWSRPSS